MNNIILTAEALHAAAAWAVAGEEMADVTLTEEDNGILRVAQGDDTEFFDADGIRVNN